MTVRFRSNAGYCSTPQTTHPLKCVISAVHCDVQSLPVSCLCHLDLGWKAWKARYTNNGSVCCVGVVLQASLVALDRFCRRCWWALGGIYLPPPLHRGRVFALCTED